MGKFIKGDVVIFSFPFSDLSGSKRRPALVIADLEGNDVLLCQITSQNHKNSIFLVKENFVTGFLPINSYIRWTKLFTADSNIFIKKVGTINTNTLNLVNNKIIGLLTKK